jgi:hypothetical protein
VCGGIYVDAPCVVDRNLVSGRTFHDHGRYLGPWIKQLCQARRAARRSHNSSGSSGMHSLIKAR